MKALISAVALLTFVAGTALPIEAYAQTAGTEQMTAPDTSTSTAPTATTTPKKRHSSKSSHHAKKKSKKSSTAQSSSTKQKHTRHSVT